MKPNPRVIISISLALLSIDPRDFRSELSHLTAAAFLRWLVTQMDDDITKAKVMVGTFGRGKNRSSLTWCAPKKFMTLFFSDEPTLVNTISVLKVQFPNQKKGKSIRVCSIIQSKNQLNQAWQWLAS